MIKSVLVLIILSLVLAVSLASTEIYSKYEADMDSDSPLSVLRSYKNPRYIFRQNKRSSVDARLLELQAKLDLMRAFNSMPAGHGQFDFERIGKRSFKSLHDIFNDNSDLYDDARK